MCGYDSIPSDLGTYFVVNAIRQKAIEKKIELPLTTVTVRGYQFTVGAAPSGGTVATGLTIMEVPQIYELVSQQYSLNPDTSRHRLNQLKKPEDADLSSFYFDKLIGAWVAPSPLAPGNMRCVRRSAALFEEQDPKHSYEQVFSYNEFGQSPNMLSATLYWLANQPLRLISYSPFFRSVARKVVQKLLPPGDGPSDATRAATKFRVTLIASANHNDTTITAKATVTGGDPGYDETAKMLCESALCLAFDRARLATGGVLTPATAFGMTLVDNLNKVGLKFDVLNCN